jgi:TonB family protein
VNIPTFEKKEAMKHLILSLCFAASLMTNSFQAQTTVPKKNETLPQFKGGNQALYTFINEHIQYPKEALDKGIRGTVLVQITIDAKGNMADSTKVIHSVTSDLDKEALRVVTQMKDNWKPGTKNGKPAATDYSIAVTFTPPYDKDPSGKLVYGTDTYNFNKGMECSKNKDYLNALFYFSDALDSNSSDINVLFYRCLCKLRLGDNMGACDDYKRIKTLQNPSAQTINLKYCQN